MRKKRIADGRQNNVRTGPVGTPDRDPTVTLSEARAQWLQLVTLAERGHRVTITRAGKAVAVLQAFGSMRRGS